MKGSRCPLAAGRISIGTGENWNKGTVGIADMGTYRLLETR